MTNLNEQATYHNDKITKSGEQNDKYERHRSLEMTTLMFKPLTTYLFYNQIRAYMQMVSYLRFKPK